MIKKNDNTNDQINKFINFKDKIEDFLGDKKKISKIVSACIMSGGNILIEDMPGIGKTTFVQILAKYLQLDMKRIQCTSDLLPSDIIGLEVYNPKENKFVFHKGPVFSNLLLADELNRSSPKTQSALLECMQEKNISVNRVTMKLPEPFFLIATQNPISYEGTYKIPESQLDRFTIKIKLDYPSEEREKEIFSKALINPLENFEDNILTIEDIKKIQKISESVHISDKIIKFVQDIVNQSRCHEDIMAGISTRGGILWIRLAKSIALLAGRNFLIPDDLIDIAHECLAHRMLFNEDNYERVLNKLFESVNI